MVRTKADSGRSYRKVVVARAPRKVLGSSGVNAGPSPAAKRGAAPRNPVCLRPAPAWQRGIGEFLQRSRTEKRAPCGEQAAGRGLRAAAKRACPLPEAPAEDGDSAGEEQS
ncbi:PCNA-associated factor [Pogoniulus pusillus]|uniref:PCNA-associated factor n=1 Tax=Pogoniulus pusillus TaxID=488313 RepID=UPI0030B950C3